MALGDRRAIQEINDELELEALEEERDELSESASLAATVGQTLLQQVSHQRVQLLELTTQLEATESEKNMRVGAERRVEELEVDVARLKDANIDLKRRNGILSDEARLAEREDRGAKRAETEAREAQRAHIKDLTNQLRRATKKNDDLDADARHAQQQASRAESRMKAASEKLVAESRRLKLARERASEADANTEQLRREAKLVKIESSRREAAFALARKETEQLRDALACATADLGAAHDALESTRRAHSAALANAAASAAVELATALGAAAAAAASAPPNAPPLAEGAADDAPLAENNPAAQQGAANYGVDPQSPALKIEAKNSLWCEVESQLRSELKRAREEGVVPQFVAEAEAEAADARAAAADAERKLKEAIEAQAQRTTLSDFFYLVCTSTKVSMNVTVGVRLRNFVRVCGESCFES